MKIGDMVEVINNANYSEDLSFTGPKEVKCVYWEDDSLGSCIGVVDDKQEGVWSIPPVHYKVVEPVKQAPNYAAAFNMWMSDYMNNPQAYEDSHDSAVRHLKEKLNGEEPSYGAVCADMLVGYLEKIK